MIQLNVGNFDRMLRILLGLALIGLAARGTIGPWGYAGVAPPRRKTQRFASSVAAR